MFKLYKKTCKLFFISKLNSQFGIHFSSKVIQSRTSGVARSFGRGATSFKNNKAGLFVDTKFPLFAASNVKRIKLSMNNHVAGLKILLRICHTFSHV